MLGRPADLHMDSNVNQNKDNDGPLSPDSQKRTHRLRKIWNSDRPAIKFLRYVLAGIWTIAGEAVALVLGICVVWGFSANYLMVNKTTNISFLTENFSIWFAQAFDGHESTIDSLNIEFDPKSDTLRFVANNVSVLDKQKNVIQNLDNMEVSFDFQSAVTGSFEPKTLKVDGGSISLKRDDDGHAIAGLGSPDTVGGFATFYNSRNKKKQAETSNPVGGLQQVEIFNATIYVQDLERDLEFSLNDAALSLRPENTSNRFEISGNVIGKTDAGQIDAVAIYESGFEDVDFNIKVKDLDLSQLAPRRDRFHELSDLAIPVSGEAGFRSSSEFGLETVSVDIEAGSGAISVLGLKDYLESAVLKASYDVANDSVRFDTLDINSQRFKTKGALALSNVGTPENFFRTNSLAISANLTNTFIDVSSIFDAPFSYDSIKIDGSWEPDQKAFEFTNYNIVDGDHSLMGSILLGFTPNGPLERIAGALNVRGSFDSNEFKEYWPTEFVPGARRWIFKAIKRGKFNALDANFNLDTNALSGVPFTDDQLSITFEVEDADVKYMDHLPPYLGVTATGHVKGNQLNVFTSGGTVGTMSVYDGEVKIPVLRPKGGDFTIDVSGYGEIPEMLRIIDNKPFGYTTRYGVKAENFTGKGNIALKITRPLLEFFELDRITYDIKGNFEDAAAPFKFRNHRLENGNVELTANKDGMSIHGPVNIGPWRANLAVEDRFEMPRPPTRHKVTGVIDRETLDRFGVGLRQYLDGEIFLEIDALGSGVNVNSASLTASLDDTELSFGSYGKPKGLPAELVADISRNEDTVKLGNMALKGSGLNITGQAEFLDSGKLNYFDLDTVDIENVGAFNLSIRPNSDNTLFKATARGKHLDISNWVSQYLGANREAFGVPYIFDAELANIIIKDDIVLIDSHMHIENNGDEITNSLVEGKLHGGDFKFEIKPTIDGFSDFYLRVPDAGKAIYAFSESTRLQGGELIIEGVLRSNAGGGGFAGEIMMDDFVLAEAPAFAQLLSFASLRGLFDTLSGSGVHFNSLRMPIEYRKGIVKMTKARTSGSALGLTADGIINMPERSLDIDGVLVPAYTANSFLGDIPLIGDIVVGKKGEGIVGLNYTIKGPFAQTEVAVNPLSALTPGFLRGIFEPNRKKDQEIMDDAAKELAEKVANETAPVIPDE